MTPQLISIARRSRAVLQEGITEAGAFCSWLAAATSYSTNKPADAAVLHLLFDVGMQRIGDLCWLAGDMLARGFLLARPLAAHAQRRRPAARGRPLPSDGGHDPNCARTIRRSCSRSR